jgi:hypothetical protein
MRPLLAEIFMLRMEFLARLTDEPPTGRFAPVPPALHWALSRVLHALAITIRNQGHYFSPTGRFASGNLVGTANKLAKISLQQ